MSAKGIALILALMIATGAAGCTPYQARGGLTGGAMGGIAGAVLDHRNRWRGGVIGASLGALAGTAISDVAVRGEPVQYRARPVPRAQYAGPPPYAAEPPGYEARTRCKKVREKVYEDGYLVSDHIKEVCEGEKYDNGY